MVSEGALVVDANNVRGARPDGWWRDRRAAMRRLHARLACYQRHTGRVVVLVLDEPQADLSEGDHDGVTVLHARRHGRDAADDRIREYLHAHAGDPLEVITSDRALADDAAAQPNVRVTGAGAFLARIDESGC